MPLWSRTWASPPCPPGTLTLMGPPCLPVTLTLMGAPCPPLWWVPTANQAPFTLQKTNMVGTGILYKKYKNNIQPLCFAIIFRFSGAFILEKI